MPDSPLVQGDLFAPRRKRHQTLVFDLETQNSFDEVGGRGNIEALKLSVGCTYCPETDEARAWRETEVEALVDALFGADLVVGFNVKGFDFRVLSAYVQRDYAKLPCLDLLEDLHRRLGFRVKLDSVAGATLGHQKIGHGLQAIEWYRAGEMEKLINYCQEDVKITYELYRFGKEKGYVLIPNWKETRRVAVAW